MLQALKSSLFLVLVADTFLTVPSLARPRDVPIKISAFGALSGPVKSFGINSRAALLAASRRIDQTGGVRLAGGSVGRFEITYSDDHCKAEDGIALLRQAAASDALAVIGPSCSSVAEPLYGALQRTLDDPNDSGLQVPVFTDGATKANLARISQWAFRNTPNEGDMYKALWQWVRVQHPEIKTVYAGEESDFAHSHATMENIIAKETAAHGLQLVGTTGWSINDTSFADAAESIKDAHADAVVISAHAATTCGVLKELARQNVRPKLLVGLTSSSTPETLRLCGSAAEGLIIPTSFIANSEETQKQAVEVAAAGGIADLHSMAAWEILYELKNAIEQSGIVPSSGRTASDRRRLRDALAGLETMPGVMGTITRTPDRESLKPFVLVRAEHGSWTIVPHLVSAYEKRARLTAVGGEEDFMVPFGTTGLRVFLRHLPAAQNPHAEKKSVLFVHGATFPSALAAAFPFGGRSWMQDLSEANFDVWALDFMGYGGSDRYPEMSGDETGGRPLLQTADASRQIETVVEFIREKAGIPKVSILAHSWGTLPTGLFVNRRPELVDRLVLFGPVAERHQSVSSARAGDPAAWDVTIEDQQKRFDGYVPSGPNPVLAKSDMDLWYPAYLATDPDSSKRNPPSVRVPRGPLTDIDLAWSGHFPYDPTKIPVPVLIVRGEWDTVTKNEDAHWLYENLRNAPLKRDVLISRGTHVMHLEESRYQLYKEAQTFLEGRDTVQTQIAGPVSPH